MPYKRAIFCVKCAGLVCHKDKMDLMNASAWKPQPFSCTNVVQTDRPTQEGSTLHDCTQCRGGNADKNHPHTQQSGHSMPNGLSSTTLLQECSRYLDRWQGNAPMSFRHSKPSRTLPKTTCFPARGRELSHAQSTSRCKAFSRAELRMNFQTLETLHQWYEQFTDLCHHH
jgi:hypothetical protein